MNHMTLLDKKECLTIRYAIMNYLGIMKPFLTSGSEVQFKVAEGATIIIADIASKAHKDKEENLLNLIDSIETMLLMDAIGELKTVSKQSELEIVSDCIEGLLTKLKNLLSLKQQQENT